MYLREKCQYSANCPTKRMHLQVFHILEAVAQIAQERVIQVLQHPPFPYNVPHAFRPYHLILPDVLERKRQASVLAFHNPDLAKCTFSHNP